MTTLSAAVQPDEEDLPDWLTMLFAVGLFAAFGAFYVLLLHA